MKIYTKTGDDGTTGIQNGARISKSHPRIIAYGTIDEINSSIGIVLSYELDDELRDLLIKIQNELFVIGADLSNPNLEDKKNRVTTEMVKNLEDRIDHFEKELEPIKKFILPGGHKIGSLIHASRTICRRAENNLVLLSEKEKININCLMYINRLSDLLFVLARIVNKRNGVSDIFWES